MAFVDPSQLETKEPREGWKGQFFHSAAMTFAYYSVRAGASIHEHHHPNDEVWNVIEGELEITVNGIASRVGPSCAMVVPPNSPHAIRAIVDSRAIVVDHPRRDAVGSVTL